MIIIGYQGIGKSSLAGKDRKFIDLESSNFLVNGKRATDWYKPYCQIAEHLSKQGYIVFTSCHEEVREQLKNSTEIVVLCYPSPNLKDVWINKLENRHLDDPSDKNYRALYHTIYWFDENIRELSESKFAFKMELKNPDYDLEASIIHFINRDLNLTSG